MILGTLFTVVGLAAIATVVCVYIKEGDSRPRSEYLLDTSALMSMSASEIRKAAKLRRVVISPVTFFELIRHLDEGGQADFERNKALVLKCQYVELLEDPFLETADTPGVRMEFNELRREDRRAIPLILEQLAESSSPQDFDSHEIDMGGGDVRPLGGLCARLRQRIAAEERKYEEFVRRVARLPAERNITGTLRSLSLEEGVRCILSPQVQDPRAAPGAELAALTAAVHPFRGYVVARAIRALVNSGSVENLGLQRNDMRDAWIVLHLDLSRDRALVTEDNGMREAVEPGSPI